MDNLGEHRSKKVRNLSHAESWLGDPVKFLASQSGDIYELRSGQTFVHSLSNNW